MSSDTQTDCTTTYGLGVRVNRRVPLDIYVNKVIDGVPFLARTKNLSRGGLYLHRLLEPTGRRPRTVAIEFALPGTKEVIWAEVDLVHDERPGDGGVGLRFRHLTPRQERLIEGFITNSSVAA